MSRIGVFGQISEITDHLYLSGAGCLKPEKIRQKRIVFIVNATTEEPNTYIQGVEYMKVRIDDHPYARIQDYFDQVADKIKSVKYERMTLRQAYHYVKSARPVIRPNVGFWKQMVDYEKRLRGVASVTMVMTNQCDLPIPDIYVEDLKRAQEREQQQQQQQKISSTSLIRQPISALSVTKRRGYSASNLRPITTTLRRSTSPAVSSSSMQYSFLSPTPSRKPRDSLFSLYTSPSRPFFSAF
ncbi:dual specificity phosphatase, catalytic domain protein [Necator americanus]|uniref:Dual specificity phosphatase, catalytic domain protein n=1 Tax=Necator americanus TaxID=51031 RepID=W2TZI3_NECAM|nr:dual specificity phosphatase, catalytic domain protein [Necator americanus]ETN86476.1 dual specificity phosphatase, catalytic domain protein [Necator americanus]